MSGTSFQIEQSDASGRCWTCKKDFKASDWRLGSAVNYGSGSVGSTMFRHLECAEKSQAKQLVRDNKWDDAAIKGFGALDESAKDEVKTSLQAVVDADEKKKSGKKKASDKPAAAKKGKSAKAKEPKEPKEKSKRKKKADSDAESGGDESDGDGKKKKKKQKKEKDPNAPKPPLSAYMAFCKEKRIELKGKEPPKDDNGKAIPQAKQLGALWNALSADEKKPFFDKFKEEKAAHDEAMKKYKESGGAAAAAEGDDIESAAEKKDESAAAEGEAAAEADADGEAALPVAAAAEEANGAEDKPAAEDAPKKKRLTKMSDDGDETTKPDE